MWPWIDGTGINPTIEAYSDEIVQSLARAGLPVRRGGFDGVPDEVAWEEGQVIHPEEVEVYRQTAIVAVFTDGAVLASRLRYANQVHLLHLLRGFGYWPPLAFFDFSRGANALGAALSPFGIPCLRPEDLPAFLGVQQIDVEAKPRDTALGELRRWAVCLALSSRPVERRAAYALRRELGLDVSPWALRRLTTAPLTVLTDGAAGASLDQIGARLILGLFTTVELVGSADRRIDLPRFTQQQQPGRRVA